MRHASGAAQPAPHKAGFPAFCHSSTVPLSAPPPYLDLTSVCPTNVVNSHACFHNSHNRNITGDRVGKPAPGRGQAGSSPPTRLARQKQNFAFAVAAGVCALVILPRIVLWRGPAISAGPNRIFPTARTCSTDGKAQVAHVPQPPVPLPPRPWDQGVWNLGFSSAASTSSQAAGRSARGRPGTLVWSGQRAQHSLPDLPGRPWPPPKGILLGRDNRYSLPKSGT